MVEVGLQVALPQLHLRLGDCGCWCCYFGKLFAAITSNVSCCLFFLFGLHTWTETHTHTQWGEG